MKRKGKERKEGTRKSRRGYVKEVLLVVYSDGKVNVYWLEEGALFERRHFFCFAFRYCDSRKVHAKVVVTLQFPCHVHTS